MIDRLRCSASTYAVAQYLDAKVSELRKRPGNSDVGNASRDCFGGRAFCLRPLKQSHHALSTSLLPGLLRNSEVANIYVGFYISDYIE